MLIYPLWLYEVLSEEIDSEMSRNFPRIVQAEIMKPGPRYRVWIP